MFALPYSIAELTNDDIEVMFPDEETLMTWKKGKKARWPPLPTRPILRYLY